MSSFSSSQVRAAFDLQRDLVEQGGLHPARAAMLIRGALNTIVQDFGMGKVHQTRRVRHELPGVHPRMVISGEQ